ncbi:hypothetical protein RGR602_PC00946 (plasmid) [Rhizobium gallicum bv. gallicum R602sp]|uniref:Uncharacterized protein n=1 Tax=Rhizobium gallicum bv. gallicum R602sp TaxID=1041138 RepID=A0A0B4XAH8_9HYPH|nr:hypothetical protein RGR602_PC00946 [Rhizobium gallicum bv. gallicum R602sp]
MTGVPGLNDRIELTANVTVGRGERAPLPWYCLVQSSVGPARFSISGVKPVKPTAVESLA